MAKTTRAIPFTKDIPDVATARRCVQRVQQYLREHESPRAARDLAASIAILIAAAKPVSKRRT